MTDVASVLKAAQKKHGENIGGIGVTYPDVPRLRTGILAFDLASGGGIPLNKMTMVYGPESSGKTNFVMACIRAYQQQFPDKHCVMIDIEQALSTEWAAKQGVDVKKLVYIRPDYAEQVVDLTEQFLTAKDCGLIALDSIAAMTTMAELAKDAEGDTMGGNSRTVGKLVRRCTTALGESEKEGRCPTLLWVNQIRWKIGVMFGNPETFPGGEAQKFMAALRLRVAGKNIVDPKISKAMPVRKLTSAVIQKWKVPIRATHFKYEMAMKPHAGLEIGQCDDKPIIRQYLKTFALMANPKPGEWVFKPSGEVFGTQGDLIEYVMHDGLEQFVELVVELLDTNPAGDDQKEE